MSLADLTYDQWQSFDLTTARRVAQQAADLADGRMVAVEALEHLGARMHRIRIERNAQEFALVPGGALTLGFDPDTWQSTPEQGFGYGPICGRTLLRCSARVGASP